MAAIFKMAAKSLWDQIEKWQQGFLSSKYYLDDIKSICQDYIQKYDNIDFFTFTDGLLQDVCPSMLKKYCVKTTYGTTQKKWQQHLF